MKTKMRIKMKKKLMILAIALAVSTVGLTTVWASVTFVKPQDVIKKVDGENAMNINYSPRLKGKTRTRAPEPSTMALFGGGFLGMVVSFLRRTYAFVKRMVDVLGALVGFFILSPLLLMTALLVKLTSKGPMIYSQIRVGKDGKDFRIYKFRTMKTDAEKNSGPVWAAKNDNRLTPVGSFLRKAHLDELAQLVNVLKGDMSIVGPRPERPVFVEQFKESIPDYEKRLEIKPGITGLAQVWHRYDESVQDVKKKLKYDILYAKKMCLMADFNIIMRTFRVVFTGEGAR